MATVCPPVVEYSGELQARAADEVAMLPQRSEVAGMLSDYAVMREQARACETAETELSNLRDRLPFGG